MRLLPIVARLVPALGLAFNGLRFPGLKTGLGVTVEGGASFRYGSGVSFGDGSRVENFSGGIVIGGGTSFSRHVHLVAGAGAPLAVGARSVIQDHCRIYGDVQIGRRCIFAPNIFISSGTHTFDAMPAIPIQIQEQLVLDKPRPVRIGDDCWLGINVVIARGVTVGRGCVIGANAVVTRDVAPYSVVAGNPARLLRQRLSFTPKSKIDARLDSDIPYFYEGFEFGEQPRTYLEAPDGYFVLAMAGTRGIVKLRISGRGQVRFCGQTASISQEPVDVEFSILEKEFSNFLRFEADAPCRLYSAELA